MESDQNRPQADGIERPPADPAPGLDPAPGRTGEGEFSGFKNEWPQAERHARAAAEAGQVFGAEPDFSGFKPDVREAQLPRWLHLSLLWILGLGAAAALVMAGMFITQQRKTDRTLELLAVSSRSMEVPVTPAAAPLAEKKPSDMVFLPAAAQPGQIAQTGQTGQTGENGQNVQSAPTAQSAPAGASRVNAAAGRADAAVQGANPAAPSRATQRDATRANAGPGVAPPDSKATTAKLASSRAKQIAKKKKPRPKKATAIARRGETQTWPRRRGDSITERLNAAVAACRARPHAPGECNLRACDILGSSDPACR